MTTSIETTSSRPGIVQRHMGFSFSKDLPKYWVGGDPFETHLLNALSLTFPKGEQMFIDSVRLFRDKITDPQLLEDVRAFIGQETQHKLEHDGLNKFIASFGYPVQEIYDFIDLRQGETESLSPEVRLAITCALEHFTAIMADSIMRDDEFLEAIHEDLRALWIWHAIEETEHKAVAFDVYQAIGGDYRTRVTTMALVTLQFITNISTFQWKLMKADGQHTNVRSIVRGVYRSWGPNGRFSRLIPDYLAYYKPSFHPWQQENREVVAKWRAWVDSKAKRIVADKRREMPKAA